RLDAGTVGKSAVRKRCTLVDARGVVANDELDHIEKLVFVDELDVREHDLARHFYVDMVVAVDHDLGYSIVPNQRLDRPELLVVLVDVDARDPDCHSASLRS